MGDAVDEALDADVSRIRKTNGNPPRVSVIDAIRVLTRSLYAKDIWRDLTRTFPEVGGLAPHCKFPGRGQSTKSSASTGMMLIS